MLVNLSDVSKGSVNTVNMVYMSHHISSQIIIDVSLTKCASLDCRDMLHTELSFMGIGILNCKCAVHPPSNNSAAMLDDTTANAIFPMALTVESIASMRKVFPKPPGAFRKNILSE